MGVEFTILQSASNCTHMIDIVRFSTKAQEGKAIENTITDT